MQNNKTREQQRRILERKPDMPDGNQAIGRPKGGVAPPTDPHAEGGLHRGNRANDDRNNPGPTGHETGQHASEEEKG